MALSTFQHQYIFLSAGNGAAETWYSQADSTLAAQHARLRNRGLSRSLPRAERHDPGQSHPQPDDGPHRPDQSRAGT